ncbi:hypothetical protein GETHLI_02370 [Geothrix limicola]|uniref:Probable chemoreceptor glutamine deamidase CheD n=1 Tax=Geothrix limicola TaxID=2927978 RepID=A0ABQ5QC88_9BACT|nr:chemotaxis protein CheD [Geothrix limicola]GLH71735.1 hypothetical protein GETHLI_02370 [Geothrix limicola]
MFFAHREEHLISTLLGSCVSVCLWDANLRCGGMNHYMLPLWNGKGLPTPKYGNIAIEKLVKHLLALGCRKGDLVAKVFGGASVIDLSQDLYSVGERNIQLAEEALKMNGIPILASEVGGTQAMKVEFNTKLGSVLVRKVVRQDWVRLPLPEGNLPKRT